MPPIPPPPPLAEQLRAARTRAGLSQPELARRVRIAQSTIARYETGERVPPVRHLQDLARELGTVFLVGV